MGRLIAGRTGSKVKSGAVSLWTAARLHFMCSIAAAIQDSVYLLPVTAGERIAIADSSSKVAVIHYAERVYGRCFIVRQVLPLPELRWWGKSCDVTFKIAMSCI